jgi:hypothetical protein
MMLFLLLMPAHKLKRTSLRWTYIRVQPGEQAANASRGQRYAGVGRSVIEVDGVPVSADGLSARKHDVIDVSATFIGGFGPEDP